jgi:hypothetical protein
MTTAATAIAAAISTTVVATTRVRGAATIITAYLRSKSNAGAS